MPQVIVDTGPIVAALVRQDRHHAWAAGELGRLAPPLLTCEAVLSEACFLTARHAGSCAPVLELLRRGVVEVAFRAGEHAGPIAQLLAKYADVPMSFADACLVRMTETLDDAAVFTVDDDFRVYRRLGRKSIPLIAPPRRR